MERGASRYCNHWQFCSRKIKFYQHNQRVSAYYIFLPFFLVYPWNGGELLETFIWCYSMGQKPNVSNETQFISVSYRHHHQIILGGFALNLSFFQASRRIFRAVFTRALFPRPPWYSLRPGEMYWRWCWNFQFHFKLRARKQKLSIFDSS